MPRVFGIGLPFSGDALLETVFEANGLRWRHHASGRLAMSIAYARATHTRPLAFWSQAVGFSGLYGPQKPQLPAIPAYGMFRVLHRHFPDAYFINTLRDPSDWVAARYLAEDGRHRAVAAVQAGVTEEALPAIWLEQYEKHRLAAAAYFSANPRFIEHHMTETPVSDLCRALSPDFELTPPEVLPQFEVTVDQIEEVLGRLDAEPPDTTPAAPDAKFVAAVAAHCRASPGPEGAAASLSKSALHWAPNGAVVTPGGDHAPLVKRGTDRPFLLDPNAGGYERVQVTLNELERFHAKPPLWIDMMDARFIGSKGRRAAPPRTLAYNRRQGAHNITLWPLAGYHSIAPTGTPGGYAPDPKAFAQKQDRCVWLGNMTGRMSGVLAPQGRPLESVYAIRDRADGLADDAPEWADIIGDFDAVPRYRLVKTFRGNPDSMVGFVLRAN